MLAPSDTDDVPSLAGLTISEDKSGFEVLSLLNFKKSEGGVRNRQDRRQCFASDELDDLVRALPGLPLCIRYDETRIVGSVMAAFRAITDDVWVRVYIDGSTEDGALAVQRVQSKIYKGLGLGHWFEQDLCTGKTNKTARCVALERR